MPFFNDVYKTLVDDIKGGFLLLKSTIWGTYKSCNMNLDLAKDGVIETKSRLKVKFSLDKKYSDSSDLYVYIISKKYMLDSN